MSTKFSGRKKKILVIDDDAGMTTPLSQFLHKQGYSVKISDTGIEGIKITQKWEPEVILLDIGLPDISGSEVFEEIKKRQAKARVIMFSGRDDIDSIIKFMRSGASDYITKPVMGEELIWKIDRAIELGASIDRQKELDGARLENIRLASENEKIRIQLRSEQEKIERINSEIETKGNQSRFVGFAVRTFYIILSAIITWLFFQARLITDTKLLFLLPLFLFILLLFPVERIQRISAKHLSSEANVDVRKED